MKKFREQQWPALIAWLLVVVVAVVTLPNVSALVRQNGAVRLPASVQSSVADRIAKKANGNKNVRTYTAVFSNGNRKLTAAQSERIDAALTALHSQKHLAVQAVLAPNANAQTKKQLIAADRTTQLAQITVKKAGTVKPQVEALTHQLKVAGVKTYVNGVDALNDDFSTVTERGIQKTEVIAIVFIFVVLILVFRSPIVPVISLLNVGVAFITSLSIVMNLAQHAGFPISNFTQVFLVVVLFGIGTDYNILLYDYFKGELAKGQSAQAAMRATRRHGGRTVLYSGVSVLIGFSVLWLAKFSFYQSASAVAIGVLVLLPVLLTLNMFFMATLGERLFWPSKVAGGSTSSRLWHGLSKAALARPAVILAAVFALAVPFAATFGAEENFNNADELPSSYPSKAGYVVIQKHFSKGMTAPATVYIQSQSRLDTPAKLAAIDALTQYLQKEPGVKTVASVTEPGGTKITAMYLKSQLATITQGLAASQKGLAQIKAGLSGATTQLDAANLGASVKQVQQLASGTQQLASGAKTLDSGLGTYATGVQSANVAAGQLASGATKTASGAKAVASGSQAVASGATQVASGAKTAAAGAGQTATGSTQAATGAKAAAAGAASIATNSARLATGAQTAASGSATLAAGVTTLTQQLPALTSKLTQLQTGTGTMSAGMQTLESKVDQLAKLADSMSAMMPLITAATKGQLSAEAITELQTAVTQLTAGAKTMNDQVTAFTATLPALSGKVTQLTTGTQALATGTKNLADGTDQLASGATQLASANAQLASAGTRLATANTVLASGLNRVSTGAAQVATGAQTLDAGASQVATADTQLAQGTDQLHAGTQKLAGNNQALTTGAQTLAAGNTKVNAGVQQMKTQMSGLVAQVGQLQTGLKTATKGLGTLQSGNKAMRQYLGGLQSSYLGSAFYLPQSSIDAKAFAPALAAYMAAGRKITTLTVVFKGDPNSSATDRQFTTLKRDLSAELKHGKLAGATVAVGGQTAQDHDLRQLANGDFTRTAAIMVIGIGLALIVVTQSLLQPLTIIGTLLAAYVSAMGLTRLVSAHVLGRAMLTWNTPFFTFIMLMALGVDYSIFLMIRYKDDAAEPDLKSRMLKAATAIGAVVVSAAIILGGTFAALMPSGVTTLIQVALGVIFGLVILVIILPLTMSALISLTDWHERREHATH
ncbi:MMPL family transporter [Lacticaseibacillus suihuaensis]